MQTTKKGNGLDRPAVSGPVADGTPAPTTRARPTAAAPARPSAVLAVRGLVKKFGDRTALDGFDLTVRAGEITGLVGHNGAGKTTFVEIVTGLLRPDAGTVTVAGIDALRASRRTRRLMGVAPQEQALYISATVRDNLRLFGSLAGLRGPRLRTQIDTVASELRLTDVLGTRTGLLSGGQRRRTQAAAALIGEPPLLLLDEPTAGADPETRAALLAAVRARAAAGAAIVYTTHYLPELSDLGATLAVARAGRVIARGSQRSLMAGLPGELRLRFDDHDPAGQPGGSGLAALAPAVASRIRVVAGEVCVSSADPPADLAAVLAAGLAPVSVDVRRPDLDDLYRSIAAEVPDAA